MKITKCSLPEVDNQYCGHAPLTLYPTVTRIYRMSSNSVCTRPGRMFGVLDDGFMTHERRTCFIGPSGRRLFVLVCVNETINK